MCAGCCSGYTLPVTHRWNRKLEKEKGLPVKLNATSIVRKGGRSLWLVPLAVAATLIGGMAPTYAGPVASSPKAAKSKTEAPKVTLPFTFTCPHCSMKITVKTPADWNKDCLTCACGVSNLGCYNETKKGEKKK